MTFRLYTDDISSAERLLRKIVPLGSMPSMPDGFPSLSELKTDKFDYSTNRGKVTVTADLEDPVRLLGQGMTLHDVQMTFKYNKNIPGGRWRFNAEGEFIHYSDITKLSFISFSLSFANLFIGKTLASQAAHLKLNRGKTKKQLLLFSVRGYDSMRNHCQNSDVGNLHYVSGEVYNRSWWSSNQSSAIARLFFICFSSSQSFG